MIRCVVAALKEVDLPTLEASHQRTQKQIEAVVKGCCYQNPVEVWSHVSVGIPVEKPTIWH